MKEKILFVTFTLGLALTGEICSAGHEAGEREEWDPASVGPIATWTAPLCGKDKFVVQPFFIYNRTRGLFDSDGHYNSLPAGDQKYQFQQQLFIQYGLFAKLED